jgi:diguanylate cyclase (GGDEF)-like protein
VRVGEFAEAERQRTEDELARRERELAFHATHDSLTGLPNRTLILDRAQRMLVHARRDGAPMAVLLVDLDNFKAINDALGHEAGNELLRAVAERLDVELRPGDTLGRLGGDEFVVLADDLQGGSGPEAIAERLLERLLEPFSLTAGPDSRLSVTASAGIALSHGASEENAAELLRDASIAMYRAKWDGKNRGVVFESAMQHAAQSRMQLEMDLREALARREFFLVYQPTFCLRDMRPTGVEALIRWRHPARGVVQPNDFISLLEESGMIVEVGRWVLEEACRQAASWRRRGYAVGVAVNVSGRQFDTDELIEDVERTLARCGLEPSALTVEITETTLMRDLDATGARLRAIKRLGVRVAIDDFGTGYSSLAHLQRFPVDALKIDKSFVYHLADTEESEALIRTLVQLGNALSIETLAEGIEQQQELSLLKDEDCDNGQGFLFARPLDPAAVEEFFHRSPHAQAPATPPS